MRIVSYVNGVLLVRNGDKYFNGVYEKPSFITGIAFYYEPTLKMMDGEKLSDQMIILAENYISSFVFPEKEIPVEKKLYADNSGNFLGLVEDGYFEVDSVPPTTNSKWINGSWVKSVLVDISTLKYIGSGDTRDVPNSIYVPYEELEFDASNYTYDLTAKKFVLSLDSTKEMKLQTLRADHGKELSLVLGPVAAWEPSTFEIQKEEALAWNADNTVTTEFIDGLLIGRALGETKQELVDKILANNSPYTQEYTRQLGKFQRLAKQVAAATTQDEVNTIVW